METSSEVYPICSVVVFENERITKEMTEDHAVIGSAEIRPIFLGNLMPNCSGEAVLSMFEHSPRKDLPAPVVDRVDMKCGYCFVLKAVTAQSLKKGVRLFVTVINGT